VGGRHLTVGSRLAAVAALACVALAAEAGAAPRPRVVIFPFAARAAEQRIYTQSLAKAVAKAIDGQLLGARVAEKRPPGDQTAAFADAARALGGALAVVGDVGPAGADEVLLRARLVDVGRGAFTGTEVETRAQVERLDQGAAVLAAALRAQAEAWLQRAGPATQPRGPAALVYGVEVPMGPDGVDGRVAATKTAYRVVRRELRHRPIAAPTYGLVPVRVAATAATDAGCTGAIMMRVETLALVQGQIPTAVARVTLRAVSADARVVRERTVTVNVARRAGERRDAVAARVVAEVLGRLAGDLRQVLAPRANP
jgi:hypothetical protein